MYVLFEGFPGRGQYLQHQSHYPRHGEKSLMKGYSLSFLQEDIHSNKQVVDFLESSTIILVGYLELARKRPRKDI